MLNTYSFRLSVLFFLILLNACGYHLRGSVELPEQFRKVFLADASVPLLEHFSRLLKSSSAEMVNSADQAGIVVKVLKERLDRRVLSLSNTGKANEFELYYSLDFEITDPAGKVMMDRQTIDINREYFNDQEAILAKNNEEMIIVDEMYQQAVRSIIERARAYVASQQN